MKTIIHVCGKVSAGNNLTKKVIRHFVDPLTHIKIWHGIPTLKKGEASLQQVIASKRRGLPKLDLNSLHLAVIPHRTESVRAASQARHQIHQWLNQHGWTSELFEGRTNAFLALASIPIHDLDADRLMEGHTRQRIGDVIIPLFRFLKDAGCPMQFTEDQLPSLGWAWIRNENKKYYKESYGPRSK